MSLIQCLTFFDRIKWWTVGNCFNEEYKLSTKGPVKRLFNVCKRTITLTHRGHTHTYKRDDDRIPAAMHRRDLLLTYHRRFLTWNNLITCHYRLFTFNVAYWSMLHTCEKGNRIGGMWGHSFPSSFPLSNTRGRQWQLPAVIQYLITLSLSLYNQ